VKLLPAGLLAGVALAIVLGLGPPVRAQTSPAVQRGHDLYVLQCQSCHLATGDGQPQLGVPTLHGVGAAAVDFYLSTGRMPAANYARQAPRKPVTLSPEDRAALVEYVTTTWPGGPPVPSESDLQGDLGAGGDQYRTNCAACHGVTGAGAALAYGAFAPSLHAATPLQVAEAARVGPANMPVFGPEEITDSQLAAIVTYAQYLHQPDDRGGVGLAHTGPIAEGFVGLLALAGAVAIAAWTGHRTEDPEPQEPTHV
jgi:ubiquinol-cytochrome c reductase cytochrome c subunit